MGSGAHGKGSAPRIAVMGAGAVGGYIGAHLAAAGHDVTLIDPWPEHVEAIRAKGLEITGMTEAERLVVKPRTMHLTEVQSPVAGGPFDIAILSVKSYDTVWAATFIASYLAPGGYVVSAQNSINEEAIAGVVGWDRTVGCMVGNNYAVDLYEPGRIRRTMPKNGAYPCLQLGEVHGRITPRVEELRTSLWASGAPSGAYSTMPPVPTMNWRMPRSGSCAPSGRSGANRS